MAFTPQFIAETELDAVNEMIQSIGLSPVNTLNVQGLKDVSYAQLTLHNTSRVVQTRSWWFNTDYEYPILPDSNNNILIPSGVLSIDCEDRSKRLVQRATKMYDVDNRTFVITETTLKFRLVRFFTFEEIPQSVRYYIAMRAARVFQARNVGSQVLKAYTDQDEAMAYAELLREHLRANGTNIFNGPARTNRIFHRRY